MAYIAVGIRLGVRRRVHAGLSVHSRGMKPTPLSLAAIVAVIVTFIRAIFFTPLEAVQGPAQKILYVHAPAAWVAFIAFGLVGLTSVLYLCLKDDRQDRGADSPASRLGHITTA